jgi:ferredoxin
VSKGVLEWVDWIKKAASLAADVEVQPERCPAVRSPFFSCSRCLDVCSGKALRLEGQQLTINESDCNGCGLCEAACPNGVYTTVIRSEAWILSECVRQTGKYGRATVRCTGAGDQTGTQGTVKVSCLGRLAWEIVAGLAIGGVRVEYLCGDCQGCVMKEGGALWINNRAIAKSVLQAFGRATDAGPAIPEMRCSFSPYVEGYGAEGSKISRRGLLSGAFKLTLSSVSGGEESKPDASRGPTRRRRWFLRVLKDCLAASGEVFNPGSYFPWPTLVESAPCFFCGACATLCPVGALEFDGKTLRYLPSFCTQCGLCRTVCPYKSLELAQRTPVSDFLLSKTLATADRHTCKWCGVQFSASGNPAQCGGCTILEAKGLNR